MNVRVSANSPSLWPTMFSVMYTGTCCLPLCTAIVRPMKSGRIVERRDQVLIGFLSLVACGRFDLFQQVPVDERALFSVNETLAAPYLRLRRCTIIASVRLLLRVR